MSESLLSFSEVLLFGRLLHDLRISSSPVTPAQTVDVVTTRKKLRLNKKYSVADDLIDGVEVANGNKVLVTGKSPKKNGIYTVSVTTGEYELKTRAKVSKDDFVKVTDGDKYGGSVWEQVEDSGGNPGKQEFRYRRDLSEKLGKNQQLKDQYGEDARLARIYGFAYEGTYFDMPEPTVFLVHGKGTSATDQNNPGGLAARAPNDPGLSGVGAADFQIAEDIRVWSYDKADYTIRMDIMSGMFEQVLLDATFDDGVGISGAKVSGAKVSGAKVSGAKVSGAKVSGAKVSGAKVSGAKARGD